MTSEIRGIHGPDGVCPNPEMLSAYLEGKLSEPERRSIEDHVSRCEDCYFVVRETATMNAEDEAMAQAPVDNVVPIRSVDEPSLPVAVPVSLTGPRRRSMGSLLPLAATLVVALGAVAMWQKLRPADPHSAAVRPLVEAVGKRRFFDARLTGGFEYGERISPKRGGSEGSPASRGPAAEDWQILAAIAKLRQVIGTPSDPAERAALASAHLVLGETDEARRLIEAALEGTPDGDPARAGLLSDLAATYLIASPADASENFQRALDAATRALALEPALREGLFNRALALEGLRRRAEAIQAWSEFQAGERDAAWRDEATRHIESLRAAQ